MFVVLDLCTKESNLIRGWKAPWFMNEGSILICERSILICERRKHFDVWMKEGNSTCGWRKAFWFVDEVQHIAVKDRFLVRFHIFCRCFARDCESRSKKDFLFRSSFMIFDVSSPLKQDPQVQKFIRKAKWSMPSLTCCIRCVICVCGRWRTVHYGKKPMRCLGRLRRGLLEFLVVGLEVLHLIRRPRRWRSSSGSNFPYFLYLLTWQVQRRARATAWYRPALQGWLTIQNVRHSVSSAWTLVSPNLKLAISNEILSSQAFESQWKSHQCPPCLSLGTAVFASFSSPSGVFVVLHSSLQTFELGSE